MEFKWIQTFVSAAQTENFRKTAEELYISQPSVTIHMKLLEEYLSCKLFNRFGRKISLTEEGRRFLPHAQRILTVHQEGVHDLHRFKQGFSRKLTLAVSPLIAASFIPTIVHHYVEKYPEIEVEVRVVESKDIAQAVLDDQVDLGLSRLHVNNTDLICRVLAEDKVILVAPYDLTCRNSALIDIEQLFSNKMILTHNHPEYWDSLLRQIQYRYKNIRTMVVSQVHITRRFIEEGLGVSFLPEITVRTSLAEGRLIEVPFNEWKLPTAKTYALMKDERSQGNHFLDFMSEFPLS